MSRYKLPDSPLKDLYLLLETSHHPPQSYSSKPFRKKSFIVTHTNTPRSICSESNLSFFTNTHKCQRQPGTSPNPPNYRSSQTTMQPFKILLWAASLAPFSLALPVQQETGKRVQRRDASLTQAQLEGLQNIPCIKAGRIPGDACYCDDGNPMFAMLCGQAPTCKVCNDAFNKLGLPI